MARIGENISAAGYVPQSIRRRSNIEVYSKALDKIDAAHKEALDQITAINAAIGQLELNEAEDEFRLNYINKVKNELDKYATHGNYSGALDAAKQAAANILTDPAIRGRLKYQQEYKKQLDQIQNNPKLNQVTKDRWMEENPYNYQDKYDSSGNVIGGSSWKNEWTPVNRVDMSEIASRALSWVKPDTYTGNGKAMFVNSAGEFTTDMSDAVDIAWQTESSTTKLGPEKLKQAIETAINMTPGAAESLKQDFTDDNWQYNKLSDEEKENMNGSAVTDTNGQPLTFEQYVAKKINPWANVASYNQTTSKTTYHDGFKTAYALKNRQNSYGYGVDSGNFKLNITGYGSPITHDVTDDYIEGTSILLDTISAVEQNPSLNPLTNSKKWRQAVNNGDYNTIASLLTKVSNRLPENYSYKNTLNSYIKNIIDNIGYANALNQKINDNDRYGINLKSAIDGGTKLPDNKLSRQFYSILNNEIGDNKAEKYLISFSSTDEYDKFINNLGLDNTSLINSGVIIKTQQKGIPYLEINKNNNILPKLLISLYKPAETVQVQSPSALFSYSYNVYTPVRGFLTTVDSNGNVIKTINERDRSLSKLQNLYNNGVQAIKNVKSKVNNLSETNTGFIADIPAIAQAKEFYGEDSEEYNRVKKNVKDDLYEKLSGGIDYTQTQIYKMNPNTNTLTLLGNKESKESSPAIKAYLSKNDAAVELYTDDIITGYSITLNPIKDSKGNVVKDNENEKYVIVSGTDDNFLRDYNKQSDVIARKEYGRRRRSHGGYRTLFGDNITNIDNSTCLINGVPANNKTAIAFIARDVECKKVAVKIATANNKEEANYYLELGAQTIADTFNMSDVEKERTKDVILGTVKTLIQ